MKDGRGRRNLGESGATAVEFALVAIPFFMLLYAAIEYGLILFTKVAIESATMQVAREASIGHGVTTAPGVCSREEYVRQLIENKTSGLIRGDKVVISAAPVAQGGTPPRTADICMNDPPTIGGACPGGIYEDVNRNGIYDSAVPAVALGDPGQLVEIRVSYPWKVLLPEYFAQFFGDRGVLLISSSTVLRNEPFSGPGC